MIHCYVLPRLRLQIKEIYILGQECWKGCVIYQVYPRSFCDSNADGVGDIQDLIKHAHKKNLKVLIDQVWSHRSEEHIWFKKNGAPGRNRTCDTWLRKPVLYPLSYRRLYSQTTIGGQLNHYVQWLVNQANFFSL